VRSPRAEMLPQRRRNCSTCARYDAVVCIDVVQRVAGVQSTYRWVAQRVCVVVVELELVVTAAATQEAVAWARFLVYSLTLRCYGAYAVWGAAGELGGDGGGDDGCCEVFSLRSFRDWA